MLIEAIATIAVFAVIGLLALVAKGGAKVNLTTGEKVIGYGGFVRGVGLLGAVVVPAAVMIILIIAATQQELKTETYLIAAGLAGGFAILGGFLLLEGYRRKVVISDAGVTQHSWISGVTHFPWNEIKDVRNTLSGEVLIRRADGKKIKINQYMGDLNWLVEGCRKHLDPSVYAKTFGTGS